MRVPWYMRPGFGVSHAERLRRLGEDVVQWAAYRLPRRVLYWAVIRAVVQTERPKDKPLGITADQLLKRLSKQ